ncbi:hypothetical protein [Nocardia neocaledoniensis]|uniref:hypothetical protein n=1 Tax=Nocardia neocaledoniensis TaxID=236511 RepID=UPI002455B8FF|nr:hypothetical protein [Nocardia neocaledoniensis]
MTGFVLTPERRDELADLLDDDKRFRATYSAVADYLDAAPMLAGTGNTEADQAFDLRLLHFMTGGQSANPLWDIVGPLVEVASEGARVIRGGARLAYAQTILQEAFAYAVTSPQTLEWVAAQTQGRGVVEIGAGRGYWAHLLRAAGLDVLAYDSAPPDRVENESFGSQSGPRSVWGHVGDLADLERVEMAASPYAGRALMLCWPPGWENRMSIEALEAFERGGGERLIYVGEPRGGRTACAAFFDRLASSWELVDMDDHFVTWWNLSDQAQCWDLKR